MKSLDAARDAIRDTGLVVVRNAMTQEQLHDIRHSMFKKFAEPKQNPKGTDATVV